MLCHSEHGRTPTQSRSKRTTAPQGGQSNGPCGFLCPEHDSVPKVLLLRFPRKGGKKIPLVQQGPKRPLSVFKLRFNIQFSHHIELPPDGGPLPESRGDFLYEREVTRDDRFMLPRGKEERTATFMASLKSASCKFQIQSTELNI